MRVGLRAMLSLSTPWAIVAAAAIIAASVAFPRTTVVPATFGYIERDSWTGHSRACAVENPTNYLETEIGVAKAGKTTPPFKVATTPGLYSYVPAGQRDPPRICIDLD